MSTKYSEALGIFWGASLFAGVFVGLLLYMFQFEILWAILCGGSIFLMFGMMIQGILMLMDKEKEDSETRE